MLAHLDSRGPTWVHQLVARFGITSAVGCGQRCRAAMRFWKEARQ